MKAAPTIRSAVRFLILGIALASGTRSACALSIVYPVEAIRDLWLLHADEFDKKYKGINPVAGLGLGDEGWYVRYQHENLTLYFGPLKDENEARRRMWDMEAVRDAAIRNRASLSSSTVDFGQYSYSDMARDDADQPGNGRGGGDVDLDGDGIPDGPPGGPGGMNDQMGMPGMMQDGQMGTPGVMQGGPMGMPGQQGVMNGTGQPGQNVMYPGTSQMPGLQTVGGQQRGSQQGTSPTGAQNNPYGLQTSPLGGDNGSMGGLPQPGTQQVAGVGMPQSQSITIGGDPNSQGSGGSSSPSMGGSPSSGGSQSGGSSSSMPSGAPSQQGGASSQQGGSSGGGTDPVGLLVGLLRALLGI